ncbi:hypothetical protein H4R33_006483 [Dimargaris cristalligena]|nr:hypothetical protein H4R33_006483 [Dimargaris cristalligena]
MTRGNQRDLAREKNRKKAEKAGKASKTKDGRSLIQKKEDDAAIMRAKQQKNAEKAAEPAKK